MSFHKKEIFKYNLRNKKISSSREQEIMQELEDEIVQGVADIVASAIESVHEYSMFVGINDALEEIQTHSIGDYIQISFESGRTDFSTPEWGMLPSLLKNPKISKEGELYKVIPIGSSRGKKPHITKNIGEGISAMRNTKTSLEDAANRMSANFNMSAGKVVEPRDPSHSGVNFATASSKQDPTTSWVYPSKDMDMTFLVSEKNHEIMTETDSLIDSILEKYNQMLDEE